MSATVIISVCTAVCVFAGQRGEGSIVHGMSQTRNVSLPACLACLARLAVGVGWLARRWPHETLRIYSSVVGSMQLNTPYLSPCLHVPPPWEWVVLPARQTPGTLVITTVQPPSTSAAGQYTKRIFRLISPSFSHAPAFQLSIFDLPHIVVTAHMLLFCNSFRHRGGAFPTPGEKSINSTRAKLHNVVARPILTRSDGAVQRLGIWYRAARQSWRVADPSIRQA